MSFSNYPDPVCVSDNVPGSCIKMANFDTSRVDSDVEGLVTKELHGSSDKAIIIQTDIVVEYAPKLPEGADHWYGAIPLETGARLYPTVASLQLYS